MNKNEKNRRLIVGAAVVTAALIVFALIGFFLADAKVFDVNPFKFMFTVLSLGVGAVLLVYALITKGGYEFAVGGICLDVGLVLLLAGSVKWYGIVVIAIAVLALVVIGLMLLKSKQLLIERTDEKTGYKPFKSYSEQLKEKDNPSEGN